MKKSIISTIIGIPSLLVILLLSGCLWSPASTTSSNLSKAADNFEILRRIVFYNGITGDYMMVIEGRCSIEYDRMDNQLEVTCKIDEEPDGTIIAKKHFLGLSHNVTYIAEQVEDAGVSDDHFRVFFRPSTMVPEFDPSFNYETQDRY